MYRLWLLFYRIIYYPSYKQRRSITWLDITVHVAWGLNEGHEIFKEAIGDIDFSVTRQYMPIKALSLYHALVHAKAFA